LIEINFGAGRVVRDRRIDVVIVHNVDRRTGRLTPNVLLFLARLESEIASKRRIAIQRIIYLGQLRSNLICVKGGILVVDHKMKASAAAKARADS
jgi:hypothetical protein